MAIFRICLCCFLCLAAATRLFAQDVGENLVGAGFSSLGPTVQGSYRFAPDLRVRGLAIGGLNFSETETDDDGNQYDVDVEVAAAGILLDLLAEESGWRFSGGVLFDLSDISAVGTGGEAEAFVVNGQTFTGGNVEVDATLQNSVAPMVTMGYDHDFGNNWVLSGEIGAILIGGVELEFTADSELLQAEVDADQDILDLQKDADQLNILPYISVIVSYRF